MPLLRAWARAGADAALIKERARCQHRAYRPANAAAHWSRDLARLLITALPDDARVRGLVEPGLRALGRKAADARLVLRDRAARDADAEAAWARRACGSGDLAAAPLGRLLAALTQAVRDGWASGASGESLADDVTILGYLFLAARHDGRDALLAQTIADLYAMTVGDTADHGRGRAVRDR